MGLFDGIRGRLGKQDESEYYDEDEYEYAQDDYDDAGDSADADLLPELASTRQASVFSDFAPLVSLSDVRSQELPRLNAQGASARGSQGAGYSGSAGSHGAGSHTAGSPSPSTSRGGAGSAHFKDSLPFAGNPAQALNERDAFAAQGQAQNQAQGQDAFAAQDTGSLPVAEVHDTRAYSGENSGDPLLQRHSLSNTGDFSTTSPAYYASRSGVGHVRPAGLGRRTNTFREAVVVRPETYAEAEQIALNLKRGNAVVLVLAQTRAELAKRILDFSFGAAAATDGQVTGIGERIYALTRDHPLTQAEKELLQARGIL